VKPPTIVVGPTANNVATPAIVKPPIIVVGPTAGLTAQRDDMIPKPVAPNAVQTAQPGDMVNRSPNAIGTAQPNDMIPKPVDPNAVRK
jgi:hypothetical protein